MVIQYQNELLGLALIFILLLLYMYIKRKSASSQKYNKDKERIEINKQEQKKKEIKQEIKTIISPTKQQIENTVPDHEKITKKDFNIFAGEKILVAEDNFINQKVILGLLGDSGMKIVMADDGQEVLNILKNDNNFSLILMDAHMPNIDGLQATKIIRENPAYNHITVVALSGDTSNDDIQKMKDAGMSEHLEKPLNIDALYNVFYKYSKNTQPKQDVLKTLNIKKGLEISGNDIHFYHDILNEFISTYSNSAQELELLLKNSKKAQSDQFLLDIIGVAANIGADELASQANKIKKSLSEDNSININDYKNELNTLINKINEYLSTCK